MRVMSAYLSLSPLLHFVPKFSIQKIKGGGKTSERAVRGRGGRERGGSAIMDFISNPPPICRAPEKGTPCPKNAHFKTATAAGRRGGGGDVSFTDFGPTRTHDQNVAQHTCHATFPAPEAA